MYIRPQSHILQERIAEPRQFIQVIVGPRQVGKSTMVQQVLEETTIPHIYETADTVEPSQLMWIHEIWERVRAKMEFSHLSEYLLVIDEIQKINNWSEYVKKEWDFDTRHKRNIKVVLLGSSRIMLQHGLTESLMGRFELIRMGHWTYMEMRDAFGWDINQYIYYGGYPAGATLIQKETRWKNYVRDAIIAPSITKDVLMTSFIYKPALLKQLFELGCAYSGEILSLNKMLGQLQDAGNVTTLAAYITLLDEANLLKSLHKYANDTARRYNSIPKYQVYNTALLTQYSGTTFENDFTTPSRWGRWVESAVGAYLVNCSQEVGYTVSYWRENNNEVDFILRKQEQTVAIEVKSGKRMMNKGLSVFSQKFNPKYAIVIGSEGFSLEEFFLMDLNVLFG